MATSLREMLIRVAKLSVYSNKFRKNIWFACYEVIALTKLNYHQTLNGVIWKWAHADTELQYHTGITGKLFFSSRIVD